MHVQIKEIPFVEVPHCYLDHYSGDQLTDHELLPLLPPSFPSSHSPLASSSLLPDLPL